MNRRLHMPLPVVRTPRFATMLPHISAESCVKIHINMVQSDCIDPYLFAFQICQEMPRNEAIAFDRKSAVPVLNQKGPEPQEPRLDPMQQIWRGLCHFEEETTVESLWIEKLSEEKRRHLRLECAVCESAAHNRFLQISEIIASSRLSYSDRQSQPHTFGI